MAAELIFTGPEANTWLSLTDANIILAGLIHPSLDNAVFQLTANHIPHLITAAQMISDFWWFKGDKVDDEQLLDWPRKDVPAFAKAVTKTSIAGLFPHFNEMQLRYAYEIWQLNPNLAGVEYLPEGTPRDVLRAQAYLAALLAKGVNLWDDTKYDAEKVKLGSIEITNPKNAVSKADIVFQALAKVGTFKGTTTVKAGGGR